MKTHQQSLLALQMTEVNELRRQLGLYWSIAGYKSERYLASKKWTLDKLFKIIKQNNNQLIVEDDHEYVQDKVFDNIEKTYQAAIRDINENLLNNNDATPSSTVAASQLDEVEIIWECQRCGTTGKGPFIGTKHPNVACMRALRRKFGEDGWEYVQFRKKYGANH